MSRKISTHVKPSFGSKYYITNKKDKNKKVICRVLGIKDKNQYGTIRSPKKCQRGEEFFNVIILETNEVLKIMNSILKPECLSSDNKWIFTNEKCQKKIVIPKKKRIPKKKISSDNVISIPKIEFINTELLKELKEVK